MAGNQVAAKRSVSATLSANTVDLAVLLDGGFGVSVTNDSGTAPIWFTVSHPGGSNPVPTIGGDNCFCAASVSGTTIKVRHAGQFGSTIQLISPGAPSYTVAVLGNQDF